jgi:hypothetical protein
MKYLSLRRDGKREDGEIVTMRKFIMSFLKYIIIIIRVTKSSAV